MKKTFHQQLTKSGISEKLELDIQEKYLYLTYTKGEYHKTAYLLKNQGLKDEEYVMPFLAENYVSKEMQEDIHHYFSDTKQNARNEANERNWNQFIAFMITVVSVNSALCVMVGGLTYGGYRIGTFLDHRYGAYPFFTIFSLFLALGISGFAGYGMLKKYNQSKSISRT